MNKVPVAVAILLVTVGSISAQSARKRNLEICMSGRYPVLCDRSLLSPEELKEASAAEKRANIQICMTGKYPALCDHAKLTVEEAASVHAAEHAENLRVCLEGKYPALCNHGLLSRDELQRVRIAEAKENLRICLDGRFPSLCNRAFLTDEQKQAVETAEAKAGPARQKLEAQLAARRAAGDCASHFIDAVEGDGKIIKLDDGSIWEVDDVDTVTTSIWLAASEVVVCRGKMISVDDDESVEVTPVRVTSSRSGSQFGSRPTYVVQAAANDETFVINDEVFKAKTYCFNFEKGDRVIFLSGSPLGACVSAKLLNLRTQKVCDAWCE